MANLNTSDLESRVVAIWAQMSESMLSIFNELDILFNRIKMVVTEFQFNNDLPSSRSKKNSHQIHMLKCATFEIGVQQCDINPKAPSFLRTENMNFFLQKWRKRRFFQNILRTNEQTLVASYDNAHTAVSFLPSSKWSHGSKTSDFRWAKRSENSYHLHGVCWTKVQSQNLLQSSGTVACNLASLAKLVCITFVVLSLIAIIYGVRWFCYNEIN